MVEEIDYTKLSLIASDALLTAPSKIEPYQSVCVSISGGSDSDVVLDILCRTVKDKSKLRFVFFDTGVEMQATKKHLDYLEEKYGIQIERRKAEKPIPMCCREFGQPFLSKIISEHLGRLQKYGFQWEDDTFDNLIQKYPNCTSALKWWCNAHNSDKFHISRNKYLKEFIIANPPRFRISNKCCEYAKKKIAKQFKKDYECDLNITGMRKAEGGIRASKITSCFNHKDGDISEYRPIWWFKKEDKESYEEACDVTHSEAYTKYGMVRTGCSGCPFSQKLEEDLEILEKYEPKLFKAANKIFGDSYSYTRAYRAFVKEMKDKEKVAKP